MADTKFTAQSYREAALEHLGQAQFLHSEARRYSLAHYVSGVVAQMLLPRKPCAKAHGVGDSNITAKECVTLPKKLSGYEN